MKSQRFYDASTYVPIVIVILVLAASGMLAAMATGPSTASAPSGSVSVSAGHAGETAAATARSTTVAVQAAEEVSGAAPGMGAAGEEAEAVVTAATTAEALVGQVVQAELVGGARIMAMLLRTNRENLVLDLGHDVLVVPSQRVTSVRGVGRDGEAVEEGELRAGDIYTTGRLEAASVRDLVTQFGDSVVMIRTPGGLGSGFFISDRGHIITNYHVIENETRISVTVFERVRSGYEKRDFRNVRILALQPLRDLALIQIDPEELKEFRPRPLVIADEEVRQGDLVFAIGNPLGLERSVTQGIVSSTTRTLGHLRFIQTDASINPGNSGGPMFNSRGEVVGVVCAGFTFFQGLAFGIPSSDLLDFLRNRNAFLFDPSQPNTGIRYLDPPFTGPAGERASQEAERE